MTSSSTFSSCWTSWRARSSAMLDRSRSSSIAPLAPGEGGMQTASYYAHFPSLWQPARAWTSSLEFLRGYPITDMLQQTPALPYDYQWALFLRNHDAMGVKMLTAAERQRLYQAYAPEPRMLLHTEMRRRLAPLVHGHLGRIQLLHSLLLSLPGTP